MIGLGAILGSSGLLIKIIAIKIIVNRVTKIVFYPFIIAGKIMKFIYRKTRRAL